MRADPAAGAILGTFVLAACLAGPVGIALAVIAWVLIDTIRRRQPRGVRPSAVGETAPDEYAARFKELENDILRDQ